LALQISYSRYRAFCDNPEKFRLYYMLGLTPEGDETPTLFNFGRRRGSCFHKIYEGANREDLVREYGADMVARCEEMVAVVPDLGALDWVEKSFEVPIGDGKHSIIGRIDHRFREYDAWTLGDFKTTKGTRTKAQTSEYLADMERSTQHHFYLAAARILGEPSDRFTYHIVFDRKEKHAKPTYLPLPVGAGEAEVNRVMASVYAACEQIEFLQAYGIEKPWTDTRKYGIGADIYAEIAGRMIPKGCEPNGFTYRWKEQIQNEANV
jgi:hypothetical protein